MALFKNVNRQDVKVIEVLLRNGYYHVKPSCGTYGMIYRAAKGVYWDENTLTLYYKGETSRGNALRIISEALKEEYGVTLVF